MLISVLLLYFKILLEAFKKILGLRANPTNSENFLAAVPARLKQGILEFLQFKEGKLPVKYLGVPLISGRLSEKECKPL